MLATQPLLPRVAIDVARVTADISTMTLDEEFAVLIDKLNAADVANAAMQGETALLKKLAARFKGVKLNGEVRRTVFLMQHMFRCLGGHIPSCAVCLDKGGVLVEDGTSHWVMCPQCKGEACYG